MQKQAPPYIVCCERVVVEQSQDNLELLFVVAVLLDEVLEVRFPVCRSKGRKGARVWPLI